MEETGDGGIVGIEEGRDGGLAMGGLWGWRKVGVGWGFGDGGIVGIEGVRVGMGGIVGMEESRGGRT